MSLSSLVFLVWCVGAAISDLMLNWTVISHWLLGVILLVFVAVRLLELFGIITAGFPLHRRHEA